MGVTKAATHNPTHEDSALHLTCSTPADTMHENKVYGFAVAPSITCHKGTETDGEQISVQVHLNFRQAAASGDGLQSRDTGSSSPTTPVSIF